MKLQLKSLWVAMLAVGMAACNSDDDQVSPTPVDPTPNTIELSKIGAYQSGIFAESAAEIPAYDAASKRLFVVNAQAGVLDVLDLSQPNQPVKIAEIQVHDIAEGAEVNSVAVHNGIVAIAIQAAVKTDPGYVALYQAKDLSKLAHVQVGALPDMLTFSPDGQTLLVANEGEPSDDYQVDPEGSISVIQLSNLTAPVVRTADFKAFNGQESALRAQGVRIFGPNATAAQDFEPEYITVSQDGKTAWAALQENNALAKIDVVNAKVLAVYPLGFKDHGLDGNGMDVSDADGVDVTGSIKIQTWANVRGLYMPDAIASFDVAGKTYIVTANEGDARAWGEDTPEYFNNDTSKGFVEEWRVKHLVHADGFARRLGDDLPAHLSQLAKGAELNPDNFGYCGATVGNAGDCRKDHLLGRLNITWTEGYQKNADGTPKLNERGNLVYDHLYSFGARSVSIWTENSAQNGLELVWDSGDDFEQYIAEHHPEIFNANHEEAGMDNRSDNKGPEPEGVTLGQIGSKTFAFIGLERAGGVMVYDVSTPSAPSFVQYLNSREMSASTEQIELGQAGDLGPEGLVFIAAKDSPNGQPLLVVGNEVSGSTAVYQLNLK
ncbi:alkaline phosphatase [Acinetobacter indicus]|uniref:choice-of-anchor I family protein n=1 Tax=Acinetobacter indicus TaxID=756892 RepID=UPI00159F5551|nr:choice-of-anchor I family protein [Acinetobacter indicus]QLB58256.1 alkaline phosphatase [Acinetobacter indicus]